ncbi:penicillin-binding protein 1A [Amylibacter marinus]|uniref:Penicillin-binding protein 1A n=1 Tax=Amylibacter marinus TaxID=1475483 RepID=A0ABQ5VSL1_9RHOB|nr:PBP1A family penicillin-binding protein [Amylibacter marinus]GLQ34351.1 penicillin-binding protein 1A [Amylibacter marinus]
MLRFVLRMLGGLFALGTLGSVLGVAMLAALFLVYGKDLPDHEQLASYEPATISRVYSIDGSVMDEFAQERRMFTPAPDIPDLVKQAFISAEDKNFYDHAGYDPVGIAKALAEFGLAKVKGQRAELRGASTITQQVAKNFLLDGSRKLERKVKEIILATRIESTLGKDKILELYLNEIFLGQNSYGVTAAAETYFSKPLEDLNLQEVAYLAGLPKAPSDYHPIKQRARALNRRNYVLGQLYANDYISLDQSRGARSSELVTVQGGDIASARSLRPPRNYFTDEIRRQLSVSFGEEEFFSGGLSVRATMDPELQIEAENALRDGLEKYDRANSPWRGPVARIELDRLDEESVWRAALSDLTIPRDIDDWHPAVVLGVDAKTAQIGIQGFAVNETSTLSFAVESKWAKNRALEDGKRLRMKAATDMWSVGDVIYVKPTRADDGSISNWTLRQIPEVQGGFMAMDVHTGRVLSMQGGFSYQHSVFNRATQAKRQPGSSFKPFVYAAALDSGYSPASIIVDAPIEIDTPQGLWRPKNASNKFYGPAPLRVGIEQSRNLMTIRLAQDVGMSVVGGYAERFGVYEYMTRNLSASLGAQESTLFKMVSSYAMFANGGERVEPTLVDRVQDRFGQTVYRHDQRQCLDCSVPEIAAGHSPRIVTNRERVMDPVTAYRLTSMMQGVVERGTARRVRMPNVAIAGKTGTTNEAKDVWFIGFTNNIVAGCYIGYDTPTPLGRNASGGGMCGPVFKQFMQAAVKKYGAGKFTVPENTYFAKFDRYSGAQLPDDEQGAHVVSELFRIGEDPLLDGLLTVIDGGFSASADIEIFQEFLNRSGIGQEEVVVETATGEKKAIGKASFGSLSSGGLY